MIKKFEKDLTIENFKEYILDVEKENSKSLNKEEHKQMVSQIINRFEEAKKNDNH